MKYDIQKLLYRRQFILGPRFIDSFAGWKKIKVRNYCLTVHPDLSALQVSKDSISITSLGYILDPKYPEYGDIEILQQLLENYVISKNFDALLEQTYDYGGRWILILDDGDIIRLFNDPAGYRTVYYTIKTYNNDTWCASQPGIIAELLELKKDTEALEFLDLNEYKYGNKEYFFPGESSLYKEIKHLLPNFYLNLTKGMSYRYWPRDELSLLPLQDCLEKCSFLLSNLMQSAINRFNLAMTITAGRDTRLVLASSRKIRDRVYYYTWKYWNLSGTSPDISIPVQLFSALELPHHVVNCPDAMDDEFATIYQKNVEAAHEVYGVIAQGLYRQHPFGMICVKGNAIPIAKCFYRTRLESLKLKEDYVSGKTLAKLTNVEGNAFAEKYYNQWLSGAKNVYNLDILDLFQWENKEGNWQAISQLELDIAHEVFVPFNCRSLLVNMLSLAKKYRIPPTYTLHNELIRNLWPELLTYPINPRPRPSAKVALRRHIKSSGRRAKSVLKNILNIR